MRASSHYTPFALRSNRLPRGRHLPTNPIREEVIGVPASRSKRVSIVLAGSGEQIHDIEIARGLTTRDLLQRLNLSGHLSKFGDPAPFGEDEELYARIEDGEKLVLGAATPVAEGG